MANPARRLGHAHETPYLTYGHFGTAKYDKRVSHAWSFLRDDCAIQALSPGDYVLTTTPRLYLRLQHQREVCPAQLRRQHKQSISATKLDRQSQRYFRQQPDATFALDVRSEEPDDTEFFLQPQVTALVSELLACGYAAKVDTRGYAQDAIGIPVVTFPTGLAHETLGVDYASVDSVNVLGLSAHKSDVEPAMESPIAYNHRFASQDPILQVCFSGTCQISTFIGVRKAQSSIVLRPACNRRFSAESRSRANSLSSPATSIRLEHVLALPVSRTGGHPHAHIAFNPANERELAVIDTHGNWSVWDLSGKAPGSTRVLFRALIKSSGRILQHRNFGSAERVHPDGWHRVCWLNDEANATNSLLVCDRHFAEVYSIEGDLIGQVDMRLGLRSRRHRILDIQQTASRQGLCFALTSTRVLVWRLRDVYSAKDSQGEPLEMICSWSHFRGLGDSTLQIRGISLSERHDYFPPAERPVAASAIFIVLFSQMNKEITFYTFMMPEPGDANALLASDPSALPVPDILLKCAFPISDLAFRVNEHDKPRGSNDDAFQAIALIMTVRMADGSVFEAFFRFTNHRDLLDEHEVDSTMALVRSKITQHIQSSAFVDDDDALWDFVVNDNVLDTIQNENPHYQRKDAIASRKATYWHDVFFDETVNDAEASIINPLVALRSALFQQAPIHQVSRTLAETTQLAHIDDIENASQDFARLIHEATSSQQSFAVSSLSTAHVSPHDPLSALDRYNNLVKGYVESLAEKIPDRARVTTERLSRVVALENFLSEHALRSMKVDPAQPVKNTPIQIVVDKTESFPAESNHVSATAAHAAAQDTAISRLSKYTSFTKATLPGFNTGAVSEVLEHLPLDMSVELSDYSLKDAELNLAIARNRLSVDQDPRARRHAERLAAKEKWNLDRVRKEREDLASRRGMIPGVVMSGQLPQNGTQSQRQAGVTMGSSPVTGAAAMSMTQPERGPHGGRERMQKTGRKRLQGF